MVLGPQSEIAEPGGPRLQRGDENPATRLQHQLLPRKISSRLTRKKLPLPFLVVSATDVEFLLLTLRAKTWWIEIRPQKILVGLGHLFMFSVPTTSNGRMKLETSQRAFCVFNCPCLQRFEHTDHSTESARTINLVAQGSSALGPHF